MADFTKDSAKPSGTDERAEAAHRIAALLHTTMILLNSVIEVLAGAMHDLTVQDASNSPPIRSGLIRGYPLRFMPNRRDGLFEKRFRSYQIAFLVLLIENAGQWGISEQADYLSVSEAPPLEVVASGGINALLSVVSALNGRTQTQRRFEKE